MHRSLLLIVVALLPVLISSCGGPRVSERDEEILTLLKGRPVDAMELKRDWRMGKAVELRAGSALFYQFAWPQPADSKQRSIRELHLVDGQDSQMTADYIFRVFHSTDRGICVVAIPPQETYDFPKGDYTISVQGSFADGEEFSTTPQQLTLKSNVAHISEQEQQRERERFAAYLLFAGEEESFDSVMPVLLDNLSSGDDGEHNVLTRILDSFFQAKQVPADEKGLSFDSILQLAGDPELTTEERDLALSALQELYSRGLERVKQE